MNHIYNNPFRILGLPITSSEREIAKQINTLSTYAEMGKTKSFETDFPFLPHTDRTPQVIEEAKKQIEQNESKFLQSLFWFWKNNSVDELAFDVLKEGKTEKAIDIWEKSALTNKHTVYKSVSLNENLISSSSGFADTDDENHSFKKNGDDYLVERKKEDSYSIPTASYELNFDDNWAIECDTSWIDGIDNNSYGIVFGREKGSYYFFGIAGSGSYMYGKYNDWTFSSCIDWTSNNNFNKWSSNKLRIEKVEMTLKFYINGEFVNSWQAEPFFGKYFGFKVTKNQKISFRNFKFCKLVEDETYGEGLNVSSKNFSSIKNLSTLYLGLSIASTKGSFKLNHFRKGVALAKNIFANGNMNEYSKLIAGERYNYNSEKTLHFYINDILDSVKPFLDKSNGISKSEFLSSFASYPIEGKQFLNNRFIAKQIQNIDKEIETAKSVRKTSPASSIDAGKTLVKNTQADIEYLQNILENSDYQYQTITDKLSLAIIQCGIDAFNFCKTSNGEIDYAKAIKSEESYLHEYEYALSLAATQRVKDKAKENLDSCKDYIKNKSLYSCWFCGINTPQEPSKFEKTIYKETFRSYFPRRVQFSYVPVSIPRCPDCQTTHTQGSDKFMLPMVICTLVGLIIGALADGYWFAGLLIGGIIGYLIGTSLKSQQISKAAIKDTSESTIRNYPPLQKMLSEGWRFSKPTA